MSLLPFFEWCESTLIGEAIRTSTWAFAVIESIHLLGLALIGGSVLIVDLRLLGFGLRRQEVSELARDAQPWLMGSLLVMVSTGTGLFLSEALKCYYNTSFWVKMTALPLALIFTFTIRRRVAMSEEGRIGPRLQKLVALVSIALWFCVAAAGRWIGFSG